MVRNYIKSEIRQRIYRRDNFCCVYCGQKVYTDIPQGHSRRANIDHFVPLYLGGKDDLSNYVTACFGCNRKKWKNLPTQFMKLTDCKRFHQNDEADSRVEEKIMPSINDVYESKSKFLKVEDLQKKRVALTILNCEVQNVGEDKKLVLSFNETEKTLALNVTNARMLQMLTDTDDYTAWVGTRIILRPDMTSFNGKPTPCIRIDSELPEQAPAPVVRGEQLDGIPF